MGGDVWYRASLKAIWHILKQYFLAGLLNLLIWIVPFFFLYKWLPDLPLSLTSDGSRTDQAVGYYVGLLALYPIPFFFILKWLYSRDGDLKKLYLKTMEDKEYHFTTDLKAILRGPDKWYLAVYGGLNAAVLLYIALGAEPVDFTFMPVFYVGLLGKIGIIGALLGLVLAMAVFSPFFILMVAGQHKKWCSERLHPSSPGSKNRTP